MHWLSSGTNRAPAELKERLSAKSGDLVKWAMEDIDPSKLVDYHVHVAGIGAGGTGLFVNPRMLTWKHPFHRMKFAFYRHACGVSKEEETDSQMVNRLADLVRHLPAHGKHRLLAFDRHYNSDGTVNLSKTEFYVPNEYVFNLAAKHPDLFLPTISVHPYRNDAIAELETWASRGGQIVKWLPNAMGMNPADSKCDRFYAKMKELDLILLSHGGEEKAVEADEDQKLGNPLLLRRPLDHGVKVIVAHCAGLGANEDLDDPVRRRRSNFDLFMRLMDDPKYTGLVFGEISAMSQFNRLGAPLTTILSREDLHPRLINGSDYPLPAINLLIRTSPLVKSGYITVEQRFCLKEIYGFNPLLFDLVLKRCLVAPGTTRRLPPSVFYGHPLLAA